MKQLDNNKQAFFALLRAGLWEEDVDMKKIGPIDFSEVYHIAEEQSLIGLIASGIEHMVGVKIPQVLVLQFAGQTLQIEQRNNEMNDFLVSLSEKLKSEHINAFLVKGQGIAQCYERPLWRVSGDVDFLLDEENYEKGKTYLSRIAQEVHKENDFDKHFSVIIDGWDVELHGTMRSMLPKKTDDLIDRVQEDAFKTGKCRVWNYNGSEIQLPCPDDDVIFVFTHILKHFFHYGIGLRQVCDWSRLIYTYHGVFDLDLLGKRLKKMGLMTEWNVFGSLAVNRLGMPSDIMPFYSDSKSLQRKADRALAFILETGNFGHKRDNSYYNNSNVIKRGLISLWRHTCDSIKHSFIFPVDSIKIWYRVYINGISDAMNGK